MNAQRVGSKALVSISIAALVGGVTMALLRGQRRTYTLYFPHIRDAGPENMIDPPQDWDSVDEMMDQSFPASDPPAYCGPARFK